jgi:hypothetical protein
MATERQERKADLNPSRAELERQLERDNAQHQADPRREAPVRGGFPHFSHEDVRGHGRSITPPSVTPTPPSPMPPTFGADGLHAEEEAHWRQHYQDRPYVEAGRPYEDYHEAYRFGWEQGGASGPDADWGRAESQLRQRWEREPRASEWEKVRSAVRDAWERVVAQLRGH